MWADSPTCDVVDSSCLPEDYIRDGCSGHVSWPSDVSAEGTTTVQSSSIIPATSSYTSTTVVGLQQAALSSMSTSITIPAGAQLSTGQPFQLDLSVPPGEQRFIKQANRVNREILMEFTASRQIVRRRSREIPKKYIVLVAAVICILIVEFVALLIAYVKSF